MNVGDRWRAEAIGLRWAVVLVGVLRLKVNKVAKSVKGTALRAVSLLFTEAIIVLTGLIRMSAVPKRSHRMSSSTIPLSKVSRIMRSVQSTFKLDKQFCMEGTRSGFPVYPRCNARNCSSRVWCINIGEPHGGTSRTGTAVSILLFLKF